jgi:dGTPase
MMTHNRGAFREAAARPENPKWASGLVRREALAQRPDEIRNDFNRDYNRILHGGAYRRLKHKTQVFFAPSNDHVCTRIEHVNHVASVSHNIADYLGLNTELTSAIAIGHDLGHPPFGHAGESFLKEIFRQELQENFWHERNSLRVIDELETLEDQNGCHRNLNLTYAVRDGIVCHCGEVDDTLLRPRQQALALETIKTPAGVAPYTWEGCVVKISDKIAYLGRDVEDAVTLKLLGRPQLRKLKDIMAELGHSSIKRVSNTGLIHGFVGNLCRHSSPERGIGLSPEMQTMMVRLKRFNYEYIYTHERIELYRKYAHLVIESIYDALSGLYGEASALRLNLRRASGHYPMLAGGFTDWLRKYSELLPSPRRYQNRIVYDVAQQRQYCQAVLDYISGMTDNFAIHCFQELTSFR